MLESELIKVKRYKGNLDNRVYEPLSDGTWMIVPYDSRIHEIVEDSTPKVDSNSLGSKKPRAYMFPVYIFPTNTWLVQLSWDDETIKEISHEEYMLNHRPKK